MHPVEVGRAERGARDLRVSTVVKLARGLGVPPASYSAASESPGNGPRPARAARPLSVWTLPKSLPGPRVPDAPNQHLQH
jgi:hypothetical protein